MPCVFCVLHTVIYGRIEPALDVERQGAFILTGGDQVPQRKRKYFCDSTKSTS